MSIHAVDVLDVTDDPDGRNGVSKHARDRFYTRAADPLGTAVRRAWVAAEPVDLSDCRIRAHEGRYDPLTDLILLRKNGCIVTVMEPSGRSRVIVSGPDTNPRE